MPCTALPSPFKVSSTFSFQSPPYRSLSHRPDIDRGQMIMSKLVTFIFSVSKEHIQPLRRLLARCSDLFSLACLLFTQTAPAYHIILSHPPTETHTHKLLTFTVRPAVALQGAWPLTSSSKVWSRNHQAARSVRAEPAISVCYLHNCPQHTHCRGPCVLPSLHEYQPNSEKHRELQCLFALCLCSKRGVRAGSHLRRKNMEKLDLKWLRLTLLRQLDFAQYRVRSPD